MLTLTKGQTSEYLILTLNEKRTLTSGYYLFVFENITTRSSVKKVFSFSEDESHYTTRYNKFEVNTSTLFANEDSGEWSYRVFESETNTTDTTGLTEVEMGILKLNKETDFSFSSYNTDTTYKQYNG